MIHQFEYKSVIYNTKFIDLNTNPSFIIQSSSILMQNSSFVIQNSSFLTTYGMKTFDHLWKPGLSPANKDRNSAKRSVDYVVFIHVNSWKIGLDSPAPSELERIPSPRSPGFRRAGQLFLWAATTARKADRGGLGEISGSVVVMIGGDLRGAERALGAEPTPSGRHVSIKKERERGRIGLFSRACLE